MRKVREVLRLKHEAGLSLERIAAAVGLSKGAVAKYLQLARARDLSWPLPEDCDEAALERLLFPAKAAHGPFVVPDWFRIHQELKRKGVTLQLLWSEYVAAHEDAAWRYTQFCHHYRQWAASQRRSMRQIHRAGEKLFIDYCGPTVPVVDAATGEVRKAQVFVAVLGASSYTYAEATASQSSPDWIASHQRAFRFFGGVPALLVPDNLKAAVAHADRHVPVINASYAEMAAHYRTAVLPARPRKPRDKAKAEVAVQLVERWILARLRHHRFFSLVQLNEAISALLPGFNERPFQGRAESRRALFERLDRTALQALPEQPYVFAEWRRAKPGIDYHVAIDGFYYSVPHSLAGCTLELRLTDASVEVLHRGRRVACHPRIRHGAQRFVTVPEHMPAAHRAHLEWSPSRFLEWAATVGPATHAVVEHQFHNRPHPEHGYRTCLGLRSLARSYDGVRLENACARALALHAPGYRHIASILKQGLDRQPLDEPVQTELPLHANLRGAGYYQ